MQSPHPSSNRRRPHEEDDRRCHRRLRTGVRRAGERPGKAHRLVGQGLLQVRGRCAVRGDQEVRGEAPEDQDRAVAVPDPGHDPEDGVGARFGQPARRRLRRRLRLPGHRQVGVRRQARGHQQRDRSDARALRAEHASRRRSSTTTRTRRAPTTPSRSSSRPCTSSTGPTCWRTPGSRKSDIPTTWKELLELLVRQGAAGLRQKSGTAHLRHRHADGRRFERLVLLVPDLHGRLQRQARQRQRQAAGRRPDRAPGPDQRADRLHRAVHEGLLAAVVDELEGPGQQRRLPQQDDGDDAQRDDLDRREVARRHEQRDADAGAARDGEEELHRARSTPRASRTSPTAPRWSTARRSRPA